MRPKVPTLKGTEASLSCVQCVLSLVSSLINVSFSYYMAGYFQYFHKKIFALIT